MPKKTVESQMTRGFNECFPHIRPTKSCLNLYLYNCSNNCNFDTNSFPFYPKFDIKTETLMYKFAATRVCYCLSEPHRRLHECGWIAIYLDNIGENSSIRRLPVLIFRVLIKSCKFFINFIVFLPLLLSALRNFVQRSNEKLKSNEYFCKTIF